MKSQGDSKDMQMPANNYGQLDTNAEESINETVLAWLPMPGVLAASVPWLSTPPAITVQEMGTACGLLCDLAGVSSLVVISARRNDSEESFLGFITRVQSSYRDNLHLLIRAALAAQLAKHSVEPARCGDVTMETMHAAVIQMSCNISEWQSASGGAPTFNSVEAFRHNLARDAIELPARLKLWDPGPPIVNLADVTFRLRAESVFTQRYLLTLMTDDANWVKVSQAAKLSGATTPEVTRAANQGALRTNGLKGLKRRIEPASPVSWMEARDKRPERHESDAAVLRKLHPTSND